MYAWQSWPLYKEGNLYVRGLLPLTEVPFLAVVGARRVSEYGKQAIESIIPYLASKGIVIVSGFMYGVDAYAHWAALEIEGGKTIAVLGSGLDMPCPAYHNELYAKILAKGGAVVSQFAPQEKAQRWMFPKRNGLVAKLSKAVLVIEARNKSGSLITAAEAKKLGKPVMAIPGSIFSAFSEGTNELIRAGAILVRTAEDILEVLGVKKISTEGRSSYAGQNPKSKLMQQLNHKPFSIDELSRAMQIPISELSSTLSLMTLRGQVIEREGKYYAR